MKLNQRFKKVGGLTVALLSAGIILAACGNGSPSNQTSAVKNDQSVSANALVQLQKAEPTPLYTYSQLRATLIAVETAQATTTQTTTFFFNQGVTNPTMSCPSIGFPLAADTQLTNPQQIVEDPYPNGGASVPIPQVDPTGVYTGASTGTYVVCVNPSGHTYIDYWEGFVQTVSGPAVWSNGSIHLTGPSTVNIRTK